MGLFSSIFSKRNKNKENVAPKKKLTNHNLSESQRLCNLGLKYKERNDAEKAFESFHSAANFGNDRAQYELGYMYSCGIAVQQNYKKAIEYFSLAANQGYISAYGNLAYHFSNGLGVPRDDEKGMKYLMKAAQGGDVGSQCNLGAHYAQTDTNKAIEWLELAASNNELQASFDAQFKLGGIYYLLSADGLKVHEAFQSREWFELAARNGHEGAKNALETLF